MIFFLRLESFLFRLEADRQTDGQTDNGAKNNMSPHFMGGDIMKGQYLTTYLALPLKTMICNVLALLILYLIYTLLLLFLSFLILYINVHVYLISCISQTYVCFL